MFMILYVYIYFSCFAGRNLSITWNMRSQQTRQLDINTIGDNSSFCDNNVPTLTLANQSYWSSVATTLARFPCVFSFPVFHGAVLGTDLVAADLSYLKNPGGGVLSSCFEWAYTHYKTYKTIRDHNLNQKIFCLDYSAAKHLCSVTNVREPTQAKSYR